MKTRWQFVLGFFSALSAAAQVIITPGASIFGPPLPITPPTAVRNGQCPRCGNQLPPFTASDMGMLTLNYLMIRTQPHGKLQLLRDCPQCRTAFWQSGEDQ